MSVSENQTLKYKSPLHEKIKELVWDCYKLSENKMRDRHTAWKKQDEQAVAFIKERDLDRIRKAEKQSKGHVDYVTIEVPYSYGMMMTAHTYLTSVFLGRSPIFQFTGRHGEGQQNVMAVEALMDYQFQVGQQAVPHYIWIHDALKYGLGVIGTYWDEEEHQCATIKTVEETVLGIPTGRSKKVRQVETIKGYAGNKVFNVRPYKFFPDPRVPVHRFQEGEFCGWVTETSYNELKDKEERGMYFNIDEVKQFRGSAETYNDSGNSSATIYPDAANSFGADGGRAKGYVKILSMVVNLIPSQVGLGQSSRLEKWVFTLAGDQVIIGARPLGEYHNAYPFSVLEQEIDGYALFTRGVMEQTQPMNDILTWLFNSHFYNVRASLNNQFIYDPSKIVTADILDKEPGKRIRLKPDAYGTDVRQVISQIPVNDHTTGHLTDFSQVSRLMDQMQGINPNIMGMVNPGGRKTATEVRASSSNSVNRLKTIAEYMSAMGYSRLAQMQLQSTQQHYEGEQRFKIIGNIMDADPFQKVTSEDIAGFYDYVPVDGTEPIDRFAQANLWKEILAQMPALGLNMQYDMPGIFAWTAQLAGLRNIKQFRVSVAPPGGSPTGPNGQSIPMGSAMPNLNEPGQIPGVGPTG